MQLDHWAFAIGTILLALGAAYLNGIIGKIAIIAIVIGAMHFGPKVFGQDWFYEGFNGGLVLGGIAGLIFDPHESPSGTSN